MRKFLVLFALVSIFSCSEKSDERIVETNFIGHDLEYYNEYPQDLENDFSKDFDRWESCGQVDDDAFSERSSGRLRCCEIENISCNSNNSSFRANICVGRNKWDELNGLRFVQQYFVNGVPVTAASGPLNAPYGECHLIEWGSVFVDGELVSYLCNGPSLGPCPATITVKSWITGEDPQQSWIILCTQEDDFYYSGNPLICSKD